MKEKKSILTNGLFQSIVSAIICILLGLLVGYLVLLAINPAGAGKAIQAIVKNYLNYPTKMAQMKYLGNTLVKTAPLLMCALSINCLYGALALKWSWLPCMLLALAAGALWGLIVGLLKAYRNVNEVISGIMLNWIGLYLVNTLLSNVKESTSPYTYALGKTNKAAMLPGGGLPAVFSNNGYVTIAIPLSIIIAVLIDILLTKTKFGYELRATGFNKEAARYAGMNEKRNLIMTLVIGGALAGLGAAFYYLSGYEQWEVTTSSVPGMGFNGIAATFLGGLNPIGTIFASYFLQHIMSGGSYLDKNIYPSQIADLITAIIIYLCGFVLFMKTVMNRMAASKNEKKLRRTGAESKKGGEKA